MAKITSTLCAIGVLGVASAFGQTPPAPVPTEPSAPSSVPAAAPVPGVPVVPAPGEGVPVTVAPPAPIDPPVQGTAPTAAPELPHSAPPPVQPNVARLNEFQGDEICLVLRTLARQAGVTLIVSDKVAQPAAGGAANTVTARIENKTPLQALSIIVDSKGLVMDEKDGVFYVKTADEKAKEPALPGNYTFGYSNAKDILPLLQTQLTSGVAPQYDQRTNTVFFRESKSNMDKVMEFLRSIDRPTQQVMIEARLVEVTANPRQSYGINWAGTVGGSTTPQTFRYGGSTPAAYTVNSGVPELSEVPGASVSRTGTFQPQELLRNATTLRSLTQAVAGQFAILSIPQMSATLRMLNEDSDAEFLANQRVVTTSNTTAEIRVTRSQPVPQLTFNEQTAQAVFGGFQDKEFGNKLDVTPIINKDKFVSLLVKPEISNKVADEVFVFAGASVRSPVIDKRTLSSNVLIRSGDTLAIGGLMQDEALKSRAKVPVLGDIPLLGYAFQERVNNRGKRNLLIFVTPTVIESGYGTGLEDQVNGLRNTGEEYADPNGWRNNARGAIRLVPTSNRSAAADYPKPGIAPSPKQPGYKYKVNPQPLPDAAKAKKPQT